MPMVPSIVLVLMMMEFVHALQMSLEINVIHVKLVGMVSHLVKVRFVIFDLSFFLLSLINIFRMSM